MGQKLTLVMTMRFSDMRHVLLSLCVLGVVCAGLQAVPLDALKEHQTNATTLAAADPHVHDAQIPGWTQSLLDIFTKVVPDNSPLDYAGAETALLKEAAAFAEPTIFGNSYTQMITIRLAHPTANLQDATQALLPMAVHLAQEYPDETGGLLALVLCLNPSTAYASAIYNPLYVFTVGALSGLL